MPNIARQLGGSFAPPLDENRLAAYRELAEKADPPVADAMNALLKMVDTYHDRPAAEEAEAPAGVAHSSGLGTIVELPKEEVERLWDVVPWQHEIDMYTKLFDGISPESDRATRDAAFHLAWYATELTIDREPITTDKI